jgi:hypothetical protein
MRCCIIVGHAAHEMHFPFKASGSASTRLSAEGCHNCGTKLSVTAKTRAKLSLSAFHYCHNQR